MSDCLDENLIAEFFLPERSRAVVARVDEHSADCEACRRLIAEYAHLSGHDRIDATQPLVPAAAKREEAEAPVGALDAALIERLAASQATRRIGQTLKGKWQVEELLGTGGMAFVYRARHRNGRRVAIKMMRPELAVDPAFVARFLREGYVANKLEHSGAVAILDDDTTDDGTPFLVMELLTGESLRARVERSPLPIEEALHVLQGVLDVLAAAHDKGIVHRDLKPDNLFLTTDGNVKVLDFGIARLRELSRSAHHTGSGVTMGTPGWMPPEQARGLNDQVDARSDVWAAGATLYSLLTGRALHEGSTANETLLLAMTSAAPPMKNQLPGIPATIHDVLDRALAFDKKDRFPSARAMRDALVAARTARAPAAVSVPPDTTPAASGSRRSVVFASAGGLVLLVGLIAVGVGVRGRGQASASSAALDNARVLSSGTVIPGALPSPGVVASASAVVDLAPSVAPADPPKPSPKGAPRATSTKRPAPPPSTRPDSTSIPTSPPADMRDPLGPRR